MAKMAMEIVCKYQFQTISEIQNMIQILKWDGNGSFHLDPGPSVRPFLGEEMLLMNPEKNEPHYFFEALFEAEIWNHTAHETNTYAETRITQKT